MIGCDLSENMTRAAAETLGLRRRETGAVATERHGVVCADLLALPFGESFEAVFSTATFHWVKDHERLFTELRGALRRRGVLEAQCGGGPNLRRVHARAIALATTDTFRSYFASWDEPWAFAYPEEAEARLRRAGFASIRCWLEEAPTAFVDATRYRSFLEAVVMRPFLARLPSPDVRKHFLDVLVEQASNDERPFVLDYWRLNISATTP